MSADPNSRWQLDRHIPVAVLLAILIQTGGIAFFFGQQSARLTELENKIQAQSTTVERLTRVETQLEGISASLQRLEHGFSQRD